MIDLRAMHDIDYEERRPGITKIFEEVQTQNPGMDREDVLAKAKILWHEREDDDR